MLRMLLIGKNGQLGWELQRTLSTLGKLTCVDHPEIDLADSKSLRTLIQSVAPQIIINAAAYTNVDKAESEPELAFKINSEAPAVMAQEARNLNGALIHYSTDYVFDGTKGADYVESDTPRPLNVYGKSKLEGEQRVMEAGGTFLILRTSWVYSMRKGGFVIKVLQWAHQQQTLHIVDDQTGSPTSSRMLAEATTQVLAQGRNEAVRYLAAYTGLYHLAGAGSASRYEWAQQILALDPNRERQTVKELVPAKTSEFPSAAERPEQTGLSVQKFEYTFGLKIPPWQESLRLLLGG
jgi:dTDP-4-dehydrorhamnose reductase